jgi:predicted O-methyltransferase YrrM
VEVLLQRRAADFLLECKMDTETSIKDGDDLVEKLEGIRMLAPEALRMLKRFAARSKGVALEVGPYIGASTIAIASGRPDMELLTVEIGGRRLDHEIPSADILADLRKNLTDFGVTDRATVIEGWSHDPRVTTAVSTRLAGRKIGLLFFDANGETPTLIADYGQYLSGDCLIAFNDYRCGLEKSLRIDATIELLLRTNAVREICVAGGTWFGEINGPEGLSRFRWAGNRFVNNGGYCVTVPIYVPWLSDSNDHSHVSQFRLFENGRELGPAHTLHADIRVCGAGRFSHYSSAGEAAPDGTIASQLYCSSSDNSDPGTNGRRYAALVDGVAVDLHDGMVLQVAD